MELISREEAIKAIFKRLDVSPAKNLAEKEVNIIFTFLRAVLTESMNALPTIESRPRGGWIEIHPTQWQCSNCSGYMNEPYSSDYRYCPNCGADMKGETE